MTADRAQTVPQSVSQTVSLTVVELLRHAEAGTRDHWGGSDHLRPLDEVGRAQSGALAEELPPGAPITMILSSAYTRCMQTVEPLAAALDLSIEPETALQEVHEVPVTDGGVAWVGAAWLAGRALTLLDRILAHEPPRVVLCTHGDIVPAVMAVLVGRDGLDLDDVRCPKGGRFRLTFNGRRCVEAVPVPPPTIGIRA
jgi:broad specificity phosphatase PhoE